MLPDFPKLKKDIHKHFLMSQFSRAYQSESLLARTRRHMQHEGTGGTYETVEGKIIDKDYQRFETTYNITVDDIINSEFEVVMQKFYDIGVEASSQIAQYSFEKIGKVIDETGNTIQVNGQWTKEAFLETIKKILIDFDDDTGQAIMPTMYIHPSQSDSVRRMIKEAESDPQHKIEFEKIMKQKKQEYYDREANRKLVD